MGECDGTSESLERVQALTFDVFGTVVDWRTSIIRELELFGATRGIASDWAAFADAWRTMYEPQLARVREEKVPWVKLDDLHRMALEDLLAQFNIRGLSEAEKDHVNRVWHRLDPWPDSLPGLRRLHVKYTLATLSNGNVALLVDMARRSRLPWDAVLGAEVARQYKPRPEPYLVSAELLGLKPHQCMLVAAHNYDLIAAAKIGFRTAFVPRTTEYGPHQTSDLAPERPFDVVANDMVDLARQMGC